MPRYLFQLGREPKISTAELEAVFSQFGLTYQTRFQQNDLLVVETKDVLDAHALMSRLGGTIKIAEQIFDAKDTETALSDHLQKIHPIGKIEFSLSGEHAKRLGLSIKKRLTSGGRSARFIEAKNTATILHNKLVEKQTDFTIIGSAVFVTRAIQPIEEFSARDYGRPAAQAKAGMLPPKLARILINLSGAKQNDVILDPFCGSGTILMEAMIMGFTQLIGSDAEKKAVENTERNLEWTRNKFQIADFRLFGGQVRLQIFQSNAEMIHSYLAHSSVNCIATEPYLGKPLTGRETKKQLEEQAAELKKLYTESFAAFHKILKPRGTAVFIIPRFRHGNGWIRVDCVNEIKKTGFRVVPFSQEDEFLLYARPEQRVGREIWKFVHL